MNIINHYYYLVVDIGSSSCYIKLDLDKTKTVELILSTE